MQFRSYLGGRWNPFSLPYINFWVVGKEPAVLGLIIIVFFTIWIKFQNYMTTFYILLQEDLLSKLFVLHTHIYGSFNNHGFEFTNLSFRYNVHSHAGNPKVLYISLFLEVLSCAMAFPKTSFCYLYFSFIYAPYFFVRDLKLARTMS